MESAPECPLTPQSSTGSPDLLSLLNFIWFRPALLSLLNLCWFRPALLGLLNHNWFRPAILSLLNIRWFRPALLGLLNLHWLRPALLGLLDLRWFRPALLGLPSLGGPSQLADISGVPERSAQTFVSQLHSSLLVGPYAMAIVVELENLDKATKTHPPWPSERPAPPWPME